MLFLDMENIQREDIETVARHSQLSEKALATALNEQVYPGTDSWNKFLTLLFLVLGIGLSIAGIIFFFAYNWADLHKFIKIGLIELVVILTAGLALWPKISRHTRQIILTGSAALVGVLFAVFGQIYQTGANAYDFFLAWTLFITIWVLISNFAPLWLLYVVLLHTTLILYQEQVADWPTLVLYSLLFIGNVLIFVISKLRQAPAYFVHTIGIAALSFATIGMVNGILNSNKDYFSLFALLVLSAYTIGLWYGIRLQRTFFLSAIPFSIIIIISSYLLDISDDEWMLLTLSIFIIVSVTLVIRNLIQLAKKKSA